MMSGDGDGGLLLRSILENPECDTARLVYADWLDEHSRPERAEFIRVQVELAKHPGMNCGTLYCSARSPEGLCDDCGRYKRLRTRERELWACGLLDGVFVDCGFYPALADAKRGFVSVVTCTLAEFENHAATIFARHPVTEVRLSDRVPGDYRESEPVGPPGHRGWWSDPEYDPGLLSPSADLLSREIWNELPPGERHRPTSSHWKWFPTLEAAHAVLSPACVTVGRRRAGLPALPEPCPMSRTVPSGHGNPS